MRIQHQGNVESDLSLAAVEFQRRYTRVQPPRPGEFYETGVSLYGVYSPCKSHKFLTQLLFRLQNPDIKLVKVFHLSHTY